MNSVVRCWAILLVAGATLPVLAKDAFDADRIEAACVDLVLDYAFYRDRPDAEAFAALFTEDAELTVLGQSYTGRAAIRERLATAPSEQVFRHLMSTIRIFVQDADRAAGVSYVTVYNASGETLPLAVDNFAGIGEYHDEFVRTADGWKIKRREFVLVFTPAGET